MDKTIFDDGNLNIDKIVDYLRSLGATIEEIVEAIKATDTHGSEMLTEGFLDAPTGRSPLNEAMVSTSSQRIDRKNAPASPKRQPTCLYSPSNQLGSFRCSQQRPATVSEKPRTRSQWELVKRALSPPVRQRPRSSKRWRNFRPTPSRLCKMSMA